MDSDWKNGNLWRSAKTLIQSLLGEPFKIRNSITAALGYWGGLHKDDLTLTQALEATYLDYNTRKPYRAKLKMSPRTSQAFADFETGVTNVAKGKMVSASAAKPEFGEFSFLVEVEPNPVILQKQGHVIAQVAEHIHKTLAALVLQVVKLQDVHNLLDLTSAI